MSRSQNQKLKLLYLIQLFTQRTDDDHGVTMAEIIDYLDSLGVLAERKSLYSDLCILSDAGYNIEKIRKNGNTYYYLTDRTFQTAELKLLVDAIQSSKFLTRKKSDELIHKLESFTSVYEARKLQRQVYVSNRIKTMNESIYYNVDDIHTAISDNRQISFQYYSWNVNKEKALRHGGKIYRVSPWALTWDDDNYYLIAYDSEEKKIKHYRVDKMQRIRALEQRREGAGCFSDFDMGSYSKKTFGMFGGKEELVRLRCKNQLSNIMIDRFGTQLNILPTDSEHFEIAVRVMVSPIFLSWVMSFGSDIEIISPEPVIAQLKTLAQSVLDSYNK